MMAYIYDQRGKCRISQYHVHRYSSSLSHLLCSRHCSTGQGYCSKQNIKYTVLMGLTLPGRVLLCTKYYLWIVSCAIVQSSINNIPLALFLNLIFLVDFIPRYFKLFIFIIYVPSPTTYSISLLLIFRQLILKYIKYFSLFFFLLSSALQICCCPSLLRLLLLHTLQRHRAECVWNWYLKHWLQHKFANFRNLWPFVHKVGIILMVSVALISI